MVRKNNAKEDRLNLIWGSIHLGCFLTLIVAGIVTKRVFGHPEYMMLFHGPAAIFLIVGGMKITAKQRRQFQKVLLD